MRTASADFLTQVNNGSLPHIMATLYTAAGVGTALDEDSFMEDFKFTGGSSPAGSFTVGGAVIGTFSFRLNNFGGDFDNFDFGGAYIEPVLYFEADEGEDPESISMGRYYFASHKAIGSVITCLAYDSLKLMDEVAFTPTYPITALAAVTQIATNNGMTLADDFPNQSMTLQDPGTELTERQALSYIAAVTGNYVRVTEDNELFLGWYDTSDPIEIESTFGEEIEVIDTSITGVKWNDHTAGSAGYVLDLSDNPFIKEDNADTILSQVNTAIGGTTFRPGSVTILSHPCLEGGDCITFEAQNGEDVTTIITQWIYKLGVTEDVSCDAETEDETDLRTRNNNTSAITALAAALQHLKESQVLFTTTSQYDSVNDQTTITAHIYADGEEVTTDYPASWFEWYRVTESGTVDLGTGRSITVNNSDYLYGGVVRTVFNTIHDYNLVVSGGNLVVSGGNLVVA